MSGREAGPVGEMRGTLPLPEMSPYEAAIWAVSLGWTVAPGTWRAPNGWAGAANARGLAPVDDEWYRYPLRTSAEVTAQWRDRPYSPLLVCGHGADAVVAPVEVARRLATGSPLAALGGPVITLPNGDIVLLVAAGGSAHRELYTMGCRWVSYRGWVPLPPTRTDHGPVRWRRPPESTFTLPGLAAVERFLIRGVAGTRNVS
jgi:hypothetical protein